MKETLRAAIVSGNFWVIYDTPRAHGGMLAYAEVDTGSEVYRVWFEDVPGFNAPIILDWALAGTEPW